MVGNRFRGKASNEGNNKTIEVNTIRIGVEFNEINETTKDIGDSEIKKKENPRNLYSKVIYFYFTDNISNPISLFPSIVILHSLILNQFSR